jgi:hypothetical protein
MIIYTVRLPRTRFGLRCGASVQGDSTEHSGMKLPNGDIETTWTILLDALRTFWPSASMLPWANVGSGEVN